MQDNTNTLLLDSHLTRIGKYRLSNNQFFPTKFSLSDDGVNYNLYNGVLMDSVVNRSITFNTTKDSASIQKSKLLRNPININDDVHGLFFDFNPIVEKRDDRGYTYVGEKDRSLILEISSTVQSRELQHFNVHFLYNKLLNKNGFLTITIHDRKYFDINISRANLLSMKNSINESLVRNFPESYIIDKDDFNNDISKTININKQWNRNIQTSVAQDYIQSIYDEKGLVNPISDEYDNYLSFNLFYKGNYRYDTSGLGGNGYTTLITIFDEMTGQVQNINLQIKSTVAR